MNYLFEVRAKSEQYAQLGAIANIMCTTKSRAMEIAREWANLWKCVWIVTYQVMDEVLTMSDHPTIIIKDELSY